MNTQRKTLCRRLNLAIVIAPLLLAAPAAAEPTAVGRFKDWAVFTETVEGDLICYAATEAETTTPTRVNHGAVWYYVTSWKSGKAKAQPSIKVGYDIKDGSSPKAKVGRSSWTLFPAAREAFAEDADDPAIVEALRKGANLVVEATSARGTKVSYKFSLSGSATAIDKAAEACR
ncbi:MAG: invasion associated locus B family protein [Hyphomonas sp.]|uniref:invasion associated locus B family protein n=1 Tax=Hyphomonas sp. TaxID=87 RepID=UPI0034A06878